MEKTHKIFNDPVYGFVSIPYGILFDLVEHPYFQRLRNIKQEPDALRLPWGVAHPVSPRPRSNAPHGPGGGQPEEQGY
jgi:hypothetical protein